MVQEKHLVWAMRLGTYAVIIVIAWSLLGCAHGREYRFYVHDANRQLFIRNLKNKDVLTYEQADGLICQRPEDMKKLMEKTKEKDSGRTKPK